MPAWLELVVQSGSGSRFNSQYKTSVSRGAVCKNGAQSESVFSRCGPIGIRGARKPCKNHAFLEILFSMFFLLLSCNIASSYKLAFHLHGRPYFSSSLACLFWARLKKKLRGARNLLFACFPFCFVFVLLLFSPMAPFLRAQGLGSTPKSTSIGHTPGPHLGRF